MARPTKYNQVIVDKICELIATTHRGLRSICKELNITTFSVLKWLKEHDEFSIQYARAREIQADLLADEIIVIADTVRIGKKTKTSDKGIEVTTGDMVERARLMVDARKWKASRLAPKKYGDKLEVEQNGVTSIKIIRE